ncbi:helix-turn-helix domain-containing protein [Colwelliaceae bacterium 6441]
MKLGEKIKQLRNDAGLTQPELADKAQIEQSYLSKLENEKGTPSFEVISKIAAAFNMETMALVDSLDMKYLHESFAHLPEIAIKLEERKLLHRAKFRRGYILSAFLVVFGIAMVILGESNTIFPESVYEYKSMGLIKKGELNNHYYLHQLREIAETREQSIERMKKNIPRINEELLLTRSYKGEGFVEGYGPQRRYFELTNVRPVESPWKDLYKIFGFIMLASGCFGLGYLLKFMK